MRMLKRSPWLSTLGVLLAGVVMSTGAARADVITDQSGSIIIYPKVIADGTRDTLLQLSNSTNRVAFAHCFYINTAGRCSITTNQSCRLDSDCPATEACVRACNPNNFDVVLTAQQPLQWRASTGRLVSQTGPCRLGQTCACTTDVVSGQLKCPGLEVGPLNAPLVPGVGTDFEGELKCYQTNSDQATPLAGNALKGVAMLETLSSGQVSQYNALGIVANPALVNGVNTDTNLLLNSTNMAHCSIATTTSCSTADDCPPGESCMDTLSGEYNYCPHDVVFTGYGEGAVDSFSNATVSTELTLVPCTEMIEQRVQTPVSVSFVAFDEMEQRLSADGVRFDCYLNRRLRDIPTEGANVFGAFSAAGQFIKMRITPSSANLCQTGTNRGLTCTSDVDCPGFLSSNFCSLTSSTVCTTAADCPLGETCSVQSLGCRPASGILGVAEEFHTIPGRPAGTAAVNLHLEGSRVGTGGGGIPSGDIIVVPQL